MSNEGVWAPKVAANYIPARYSASQASADPHDLLIGQMIEMMGRDDALQLDMTTQMSRMGIIESPQGTDFGERYRECLERVTRAMGADFAARYAASLHEKAEVSLRSMAANQSRIELVGMNTGAKTAPGHDPASPTSAVPDNPLFKDMIETVGFGAALNLHLQVRLSWLASN